MLNPEDRQAIEGLFERLRDVETRAGERDPEAEAVIHDLIARHPAAPYYMAQTILVQETALREAREKLGDAAGAEREVAPRRGPWDREPERQRGGGGFLAGAAQTALGVTGGVLLGSAIASLFAGGANAAEAEPEAASEDIPEDDVGSDDGGGDWGGDFDMGGDF